VEEKKKTIYTATDKECPLISSKKKLSLFSTGKKKHKTRPGVPAGEGGRSVERRSRQIGEVRSQLIVCMLGHLFRKRAVRTEINLNT